MFLVCVIFAIISLLFYLAYTHHHRHRFHPNNSPINPSKHRQIIEAKHNNQLPPLQARALPNQRLRVVFGIDNAFTSYDRDYVKQFIDRARNLIYLDSAGWCELSGFACTAARGSIERAVERAVGHSHGQGKGEIARIRLMSLIQTLTLRVVLRVLFTMEDEEALSLSGCDIANLASAINDVWILSKTCGDEAIRVPGFEDNHHLQDALSAIFPTIDIDNLDPRDNPLNLILPGFETMWRVVLRAFIETGSSTGRHHHNSEWREILAAFAQNPTKDQFTQRSSSTAHPVSAEMLVNEALRLYPPTRRVHRAFQSPGLSGSDRDSHSDFEIVAADIETSQTAVHIWGPSAAVFDPARWRDGLTTEQKNAFFPFGSKPFVCPAKSVFGPRVIGLILGVLFMELGDGWVIDLDCGGGVEALRSGGRLSNERHVYRDLVLVR